MSRKNIIVFMTDQQLGDTLREDNPTYTPNVDRFKKRAVQFQEAYTATPHCCPSRASFFSGLYPSQHGVWHNVENNNAISRDLFEGVTLFPQELKKSGYKTYFSGKWHVSAYSGPEDHGFDTVLRHFVSNYGQMEKKHIPHSEDWDNFYSDVSKVDGEEDEKEFGRVLRPGYPTYYQFGIDENPFGDQDSIEKAVEVLDHYQEEEPFFMYIGTVGPHDPYTPPKKYLDMYKDVEITLPKSFYEPLDNVPAFYKRTQDQFRLTDEEHKESLRRYMAFCTYEDALFGQVLDAVERNGMMEDTIIIYLSDHGDYAGAHGLWAKGIPCYREGYNICALIGGAGITPRIEDYEFVTLSDFAPTILELAGVKSSLKFTGKSLVPFLQGGKPDTWREYMFTQTNGNEMYGIQRCVFNHKWKYVFNGFDYDELYDFEADPLELHNIINEQGSKDIVREMCKKMWEFGKETKDNCTCPYILAAFAPYGPGINL